jgi:hypothetical protein
LESQTSGARTQCEDAETSIKQEQVGISNAGSSGLTYWELGQRFEEMLDTIGDSLSDFASSDDEEDGEAAEDTVQGMQNADDEHSWVMGAISKLLQQRMDAFRQKQMELNELADLGSRDAADYIRQRDNKNARTEWNVPAVLKLHTDSDVAHHFTTAVVKLRECFDIISGTAEMPQGTSSPRISHLRLGSPRPQSKKRILCPRPTMHHDLSPIIHAKPIGPVILYPCILPSAESPYRNWIRRIKW